MIRHNTVLVLGAGASQPYGFPLGEELKELTVKSLRDGDPGARLLVNKPHRAEDVQSFQEALRDSGLTSVDAFLEHRPEFRDMGKVVMAEVLLRHENEAKLFQACEADGDWYKYLWGLLKAGGNFESFGDNRLSIVTFNYDLSLEQFLITAMMKCYGRQYEECLGQLCKIPIVHVHGSLEALDWQDGRGRRYGDDVSNRRNIEREIAGDIEYAASKIKIIHESVKDDPEFQAAHRLLSEADIVCFLGFGYNETNLDRLQLQHCAKATFIAGSCYGKKDAERYETRASLATRSKPHRRFNEVCMGNTKWDCISFLRETCVLGQMASFDGGNVQYIGASAK